MKVFSIQYEKLLHWLFRIIIYGLRTIGLAPVSLQTTGLTGHSCNTFIDLFLYSKIGLFYNLLFSTLTLIMGGFQMLKLISTHDPNESSLNRVLDIGQYSLIIFTTWLEIFHWAFAQKKAAYIMNRLSDVHRLLSSPKDQLSKRSMFIFLAIHMIFSIIVWTTFCVSAWIFFYLSFFETFATCAPILVSYCFLMEYSIVLGYLAKELNSLNVNLLTVKEFPNDSIRTLLRTCSRPILISPTHNRLADVKLLHSIRTTLYEVSRDVANFFALPILPIILLFFYMAVYNVYYMIIPVVIPDSSLSVNEYILAVTWLVIDIYPLSLVSFYVTKATEQAKRTGHLVHKLLATAREQEIIRELEHFSLHLTHEDWNFTAYGFFTLDFQLLQAIFGATATYLIIIVQFVQSTKT